MCATHGSTSRATRAKTADNASGVMVEFLMVSRLSSALARAMPFAITPTAIPIDRQVTATSMRIKRVWLVEWLSKRSRDDWYIAAPSRLNGLRIDEGDQLNYSSRL